MGEPENLTKTCQNCETEQTLTMFKKHSRVCRSCKNLKQREYRKNNLNKCTIKYEKTKKGFLMRTYRNMLSRVRGVLKNKQHLYLGLDILDKFSFYEWSISDKMFNETFDTYEKSGYNIKVAPSIDRIDSSKGYVLENIRWITHSENSRLGSISEKRRTRVSEKK